MKVNNGNGKNFVDELFKIMEKKNESKSKKPTKVEYKSFEKNLFAKSKKDNVSAGHLKNEKDKAMYDVHGEEKAFQVKLKGNVEGIDKIKGLKDEDKFNIKEYDKNIFEGEHKEIGDKEAKVKVEEVKSNYFNNEIMGKLNIDDRFKDKKEIDFEKKEKFEGKNYNKVDVNINLGLHFLDIHKSSVNKNTFSKKSDSKSEITLIDLKDKGKLLGNVEARDKIISYEIKKEEQVLNKIAEKMIDMSRNKNDESNQGRENFKEENNVEIKDNGGIKLSPLLEQFSKKVNEAKEGLKIENIEENKVKDSSYSSEFKIDNEYKNEVSKFFKVSAKEVQGVLTKEVEQYIEVKSTGLKKVTILLQNEMENGSKIEISIEKKENVIHVKIKTDDENSGNKINNILDNIKEDFKNKEIEIEYEVQKQRDEQEEKRKEQEQYMKKEEKGENKNNEAKKNEKFEHLMEV